MTTICSKCGKDITKDEEEGQDFVICWNCSPYQTPKGANNYIEGGNDNMGQTKEHRVKKEKKEKKGTLTQKCSKCGKLKAVRPDIYDKRVLAFGSVEKLNAKYLCRECRPKTVKAEKVKKVKVEKVKKE